jgi:phage tail-like protein
MATDADANYQPNAKFRLDIDDITITSFEKVTFGDSEWGVIEGRTGVDPLHKITSSGLKTVTTITLEKHLREGGASDVAELINWHQSGSKDRKSGAVVILDREDVEQLRFEFKNAWVSKVTIPELDAAQEASATIFVVELSIGEITLG